uniref:Autophagy-related protein n=1 Tax=Palpitomonas bilix TaxID=652834 RepID=A0A7S3D2A9_9EUKA|mmetsp:Transcript_18491/g.46515  ORF Transcript_18491/g.46515 Transcript_18491/m.46515 type:complete len:586 (+) Transcript_18491:186-1943(+)
MSETAKELSAADRKDSLFPDVTDDNRAEEVPDADKVERLAWYAFDWSNSVYSTVSIALFIPLFLVNLAETHATCGQLVSSCPSNITTLVSGVDNGSLAACTQCFPGHGTKLVNFTSGMIAGIGASAFTSALSSWHGSLTQGILQESPIPYFLSDVLVNTHTNATDVVSSALVGDVQKLSVSFGVVEMEPVSSATTFISFSVIFQLFAFISFGAMADFGPWRKRMLVIWSLIGCFATMAFMFLGHHSLWWLGGVLAIVSNLSFGASQVFYDAFLPVLVDAHPDVKKVVKEKGMTEEAVKFRDRVQNSMSTRGFAAGYGSGVILTVVCVALNLFLTDPGPELDPECSVPLPPPSLLQRMSIALSGAWWLLFSIFTFVKLRSRPGPSLPKGKNYLIEGWKTLGRTLKHAKKYKETLKLLLAWFIYSDGFNTISNVGILFGQQDICMGTTELVILALEVPLFAMFGNFLFFAIQKPLKWSNKAMILLSLVCYSLLCLYGILGFIPGNPLGLKSMWEMFVFGAIHGMLVGSIQSFSRTFFADLIPKSHESEFFALYGITDKGSSWMGPLIVAGMERTRGVDSTKGSRRIV